MIQVGIEGTALIIGHLVGDYIFQNDWMALNKSNQAPGKEPHPNMSWISTSRDVTGKPTEPAPPSHEFLEQKEWLVKRNKYTIGHLACFVHCLLYTLAIWFHSFWWIPWWGLVVCFVTHFFIDRFRLARWWMMNVSGQALFATGDMAPWSEVVVDNTLHLITLYTIVCFVRLISP